MHLLTNAQVFAPEALGRKHPPVACLLRLSGKGGGEAGRDADLVALDHNVEITDVRCAGVSHVNEKITMISGYFEGDQR